MSKESLLTLEAFIKKTSWAIITFHDMMKKMDSYGAFHTYISEDKWIEMFLAHLKEQT